MQELSECTSQGQYSAPKMAGTRDFSAAERFWNERYCKFEDAPESCHAAFWLLDHLPIPFFPKIFLFRLSSLKSEYRGGLFFVAFWEVDSTVMKMSMVNRKYAAQSHWILSKSLMTAESLQVVSP